MKGNLTLTVLFALYGVSAFASGQQPVVIYTFSCNGNASQRSGSCPQGGRPAVLVLGTDGNFFGAAEDSMEGSSTPTGGTVFSVTSAGKFTLLHTFAAGTNNSYPNGNLPGSLVQGPDGKIYGDTLFGGIGGCNGYCGNGVLYRVNTNGTGFKIIHQLCSQKNCSDGSGVFAQMVVGTDGNLYGTSTSGGTGSSCTGGCGTIFRITPSTGAYRVMFNFDYFTTGADPGVLIVASDGTFYGISVASTGEQLFHYSEATGTMTTVTLNFPLFKTAIPR